MTIGKHGSPWTADSARAEAKRILLLAAQGQDPAKVKQHFHTMPTVAELCDRYMVDGVGLKKASTLSTDKGRIVRHIIPLLGERRVSEITQADIKRFLKSVSSGATSADVRTKPRGRALVKGGQGTATRTVGLLGGIFSYAIELGLIDANPVRGVKRFPDRKNERFLSLDEIAIVGSALARAQRLGVNPKALSIIKLLILTGARRGEIESLKWSNVDLAGRRLRLDDSKTGQKTIPLNSAAIDFLVGWQSDTISSTFVFTGSQGVGYFKGTPRVWSQLRKNTGLQDVRLHDLRHSFASVGVAGGVSLYVVGALLGHSNQSTTQRYAHLSDNPISAASERIGEVMNAALNSNLAKLPDDDSGDER